MELTKKKKFLFKYLFINNRFVKVDVLDDIFETFLTTIKKKIAIGYCIYLTMPFNLFNINLDNNKLNILFKDQNFFYKFFYNLVNTFIYDYKFFFNINTGITNINHNIDNNDDYYTVNTNISHNILFKSENKILTILNNTLILFQVNNQLHVSSLHTVREQIIVKTCIKEFKDYHTLSSQEILPLICSNSKETSSIFNYNNFFSLYGFNLKNNNNIILLTTVPVVLYKFFINWEKLLIELLNYFSKNITIYFSNSRFDSNVIKIFINNIYSKSPCYNFEINDLYEELIYMKNNDKKWFAKNCFEINLKDIYTYNLRKK